MAHARRPLPSTRTSAQYGADLPARSGRLSCPGTRRALPRALGAGTLLRRAEDGPARSAREHPQQDAAHGASGDLVAIAGLQSRELRYAQLIDQAPFITSCQSARGGTRRYRRTPPRAASSSSPSRARLRNRRGAGWVCRSRSRTGAAPSSWPSARARRAGR